MQVSVPLNDQNAFMIFEFIFAPQKMKNIYIKHIKFNSCLGNRLEIIQVVGRRKRKRGEVDMRGMFTEDSVSQRNYLLLKY